MQIISFFLLVLLFYRIKGGQNEITTTRQLENNLKTPDEATITPANTAQDNKPSYNEVNNIPVMKLAPVENNNKNSNLQHQRLSRFAEGGKSRTIECIKCTSEESSTSSTDKCYSGES